jgi:uncharacterized integral membrane protein (TIGR00698 family)
VKAYRLLPGLIGVALIAVVAWALDGVVPVVGAPVLALIGGLTLRTGAGLSGGWRPGVDFTMKRLLRIAIILFGATLSLAKIIEIGAGSLVLIGVTILLALGLTSLFGRWLQAPSGLVNLIGVGTAICGATAILTIGPIVESPEEEMAFAVTTIFLFNMLAVLIYPLLGHLLQMSEAIFGVWTGTAIHDTSSVLAAAFAYGEPAGKVATVVKLTRTLMLVPLALAIGIAHSYARTRSGGGGGTRVNLVRIFPWFIAWFVLAAFANTIGLLGPAIVTGASLAGKFLVVMVMAAVGVSADLARMRQIGLKPLYVGLAASVMIAAVSLALIRILMA